MNNKEINSSNKQNSSEEEIDLNKLFNSIINGISTFFKGLFRVLFLFLDTLAANLKLVGLFMLVGGIVGMAYTFFVKPYYESSMTLGSAYYRGELINNSIRSLDKLCNGHNYSALSKILQIPKLKAMSLKGIQIEPIVSPSTQLLIELYKETEGNKRRLDSLILNTEDSTFQIRVLVYDTTALNGLDTSLVNYIMKNNYVSKRIQIERENLRNRKAKIIKESLSLDTLKRNIALSYRSQAGGRTGTNNVILDDKGTNPIDVYREDMRLFEQQLNIDRLLYINSEIEIIDPFIAYGDPKSGTIPTNTIKGLLGGLILSLLLILFKVINLGLNKIKLILKQEDKVSAI